ncbi:MAG: PAS domain S-box protein [Gammaproteobacteria bacterium]|nr:PAS domain S-box protein [Gammaproteobacteria bacterium]
MTPSRKPVTNTLYPPEVIAKWQRIVDLVARITGAPVCLIKQFRKVESQFIAVIAADYQHYRQGGKQDLFNNIYCEAVLKSRAPLLVDNALKYPAWQNDRAVSRGTIAYLGYPILWPDGELFGTFCVSDDKPHDFTTEQQDLLAEFKLVIESDLEKLIPAATSAAENNSDVESKLWQAIQSAAMESIIVMDNKGTFLSVNEIAARRFGSTTAELIGKKLYDIVPPEVAKSRKEKITEVLNAKTPLRFEDARKGRYFDFTIYPVLDQQNEVEKLVVFAADITERKTTRDALEKSERKYRELVEEAATIILRWDIHGNVTFFNEYAQKFFGFSEPEILGKSVVGAIVPETEFTGRDLAMLMEEICKDPDKYKDNENENIKRNGERVWIAWKNRPIFNALGQLMEIQSVGIDISARKRAEDALRTSEEKLRLLVGQADFILWSFDRNLKFTSSVGGGLYALGLEPNQVVSKGLDFYQFFQTDSPDFLPLKAHLEALQGKSVTYENEWQNRHFHVQVTPQRDMAGNIIGCIGVAIDITERKMMEEALRESEDRQKKAQEVGHVGTWDWKPLTGELVWSDEMYRIFGYSPNEVAPCYEWFLERVHSDDREYLNNVVQKALYENQPCNVDCRIITKQGIERIANTQGEVRFGERGVPVQMLGTFQDITERKNIEKELEQYRSHLEELVAMRTAELEISNKELESYSYSIAHDLRAPLRGITGFSQILKDEARHKLEKEDMELLDRIVAAGKNMSELIDDILELSQFTRSKLHYESVNLTSLGNEIIMRLKQTQPDRELQWQVQENLLVTGDARLLEVALQNLIGNAWKYTRDQKPAQIQFGNQEYGNETIYYIKDNGVGFDMQYQNQLFKPFSRLHIMENFEGTGIGLATVQRIVQRHGGRVWAEGEDRKGATFYFTLRNYNAH